MHHQKVGLLEALLLAHEVGRVAVVRERVPLFGLIVEARCIGDSGEIVPPGDRIEALGVEIGDLDRMARVRATRRSETSFSAPVNDVGSGCA